MEKDFAPDFGLYLLKRKDKNTNFTFLPFQIFRLGRIDDKLYSTTSNMRFGDTIYAVTIDFSEDIYFELLKVIPADIVNSLQQIFEGEFTNPQMVNLPFPITVGIEAKLGELISSEDEQYVPFEAIKVFHAK
ncbi:MAG: hypothetical protein L6437_15880 [Kiritimatiellae bacterium]|nr:hypothetical protein [Kiritimatiellia bacterium]